MNNTIQKKPLPHKKTLKKFLNHQLDYLAEKNSPNFNNVANTKGD